ncbi:MAG: DNA topoisomerase III [Puniceicoccaceae bacterium 5H]|nr:MAG: DNA topoisomerase III [Puniceicoccaceae bacterium 5H]
MKKLVIAEKPSVAQDIARALGGCKKVDDHFEGDEYVIAAAAGHLVELYMPEDIDKKRYGYWRLSELPIIPDAFQLKPIEEKRSKDRLKYLEKLIKRKDVTEIYNACDAGREGELIFTYIYQVTKCKKPFRRVWMQSMTKDAIREAFQRLREPDVMQGLQDAARSRSEADWLIGINGTRAITKRMFGRARQVATVGRVQTPTLSIVLQRELEIRAFKPRTYWRILGNFSVTEGAYQGYFQKAEKVNKEDNHDKADRLWKKEAAEALVASLQEAAWGSVEDTRKRTRQSSGRLYDLTSLQREANGRYGFSANRTLQIAQALYEKHKVLTYPRTNSRALPEDYIPTVKQTLGNLTGTFGEIAQKVLDNDWVKPNKRIFNNAQVSDHFAIIPTGQKIPKLRDDEYKIFDMVARRFMAIFYPPAEFDETERITTVAGHAFKTNGKVLVKPGYLEVYGKAQLDRSLPDLVEQDKNPAWLPERLQQTGAEAPKDQNAHLAKPEDFNQEEDETRPPPRFTEATLLAAMEGAGKLVDDEELAEAMKESGLGTPATRASIIEHLLREKYLEREGKNLLPTVKAENLFEFLSAVKAETLTQPRLTGEWEHKLLEMEKGNLSRGQFMQGIIDLTKSIVDRTRDFEEEDAGTRETAVISPTDEKPMLETLRFYKSQDDALQVPKTIGNRRMSEEEIQTLVRERVIGPLDGFRSKAGKPYSTMLRLDPNNKVIFDFGNGPNQDDDGESLNLDELRVVGVFPKTGAKVYETPNAYACENSIAGEEKNAFRMSRTLLGKTVPPEEVEKLLKDGKTNLIQGFRSNRTKRLFDAFLILKDSGGIGFEFPPRPAKKGAKKAAKKATKKAARKSPSSEQSE